MTDSALAAQETITTLVAAGVQDVVLSPGSRNAPLVYALAAAETAGWLQVHVRIDERVAAFTALGISRLRPAAVVTTSGTAVMNLHPAIAEAAHSHLPLIAVTADRPAELRGVGANQTTVQTGVFDPLVRMSLDLPAGLECAALRQQVIRAVAAATGVGAPAGPVHLNLALREPLAPTQPWSPGQVPPRTPRVVGTGSAPSGTYHLPRGPATVVVAGDGAGARAAHFAADAAVPLLAEPSSGARFGPTAIRYHHALSALGNQVERVVVFGRPTLTRVVGALVSRHDVELVIVTTRPDWVDVQGTADIITPQVSADPSTESDRQWLAQWQDAARIAPDPPGANSEDLTAATVVHLGLATGAPTTVLGSSMTIRHSDMYAPAAAEFTCAPVYANRGLAGIDGTIATATGIALATAAPVRAIIGDLTFAHDLGALALGEDEVEPDIQIVVLNDGGGSIFGTLEHGRSAPVLRDPALLRRFFTTPVHLDLAALAAGLGAEYAQVRTREHLHRVLADPIRHRMVVEVPLEA